VAWLELQERQAKGEAIDAKNIRKHANDVIRLAQLLTPATRIVVVEKIERDLRRFLEGLAGDATLDPEALGVRGTVADISARIRQAYGIEGSDSP